MEFRVEEVGLVIILLGLKAVGGSFGDKWK